MAGIVVNTGKQFALDVLTQVRSPEILVMGLITNAVTWADITELADLVQVSVSGYAPQPLTAWSAAAIQLDGTARSTAANVTFDNSSGSDVVVTGWFYVTGTSVILFSGGNFTSPITIAAGTSATFSPMQNDTTI